MQKRICVFCASSNRIAPQYVEAAAHFARLAAVQGYCLVCGGTSKGLMNTLIGSSVEAGGTIEGIVPEFMHNYGWSDQRLTRLTIVKTMVERKQLMMNNADAIVALPGAIGTLEELSEAISLKRLGKFPKPIIIFNQDGYYNSLLRFFDDMVRAQMMSPTQCAAWCVVERVEEIIPAMEVEPLWVPDIQHYHDSDDYGSR